MGVKRTTISGTALTEPQRLMLVALRDACDAKRPDGKPYESATPMQLARKRWPDSPGWKRVSNRGSTPAGGALGATMPMKAATVLWRLCDLKVVEHPGLGEYNVWRMNVRGRAWLEAYESGEF